jgi:aldehyde dehydrogenase (NAD+)
MRLSLKVSERATNSRHRAARLRQARPSRPAPTAVALARYFEFYAGACDKLHGETLPYQEGYTVLTWREPHGVTGPRHPLELPDADLRPQRRRRAGGRQRFVVKPSEDACLSLIRVAQLAAEVGFPPAPSTSSPAMAMRWATPWRAIPASTTSASPAARAWAR